MTCEDAPFPLFVPTALRVLRDEVDELAFRVDCCWASAASWRSCSPGGPSLIEADAATLVDHLADVGASLSTRFLRAG